MKNTTLTSIVKKLESISNMNIEVTDSFFTLDTPYKNEMGLTVYPWKQMDGWLIVFSSNSFIKRQIAFDKYGQHYRFAGSDGSNSVFELTPNDKYEGFTALECIELVRLRDAIIAR